MLHILPIQFQSFQKWHDAESYRFHKFPDDGQRFLNFIAEIKDDIKRLNVRIDAFNRASQGQKIKELEALSQFQQYLVNHYPGYCTANCGPFSALINDQLWMDIKNAREALQIPITWPIDPSLHQRTRQSIVELSIIINNMSSGKFSQFMTILWTNPTKIMSLYTPKESAYSDFHAFFSRHKLTPLSNAPVNSQNIKIQCTDVENASPYLIKINPRLGQPKDHEKSLREKSVGYLAKPYGIRRVTTIQSGHERFTVEILIMSFFKEGNLVDLLEREHAASLPISKRIESGLDYFQQMAQILLDMENKGIAFPDSKNENWLINDNHRLIVVDTKSFVACNPMTHVVDLYQIENAWHGLVSSHHRRPIELATYVFCADKMHAFIMGKNLCQYFTKKGSIDLNMPDQDDPIFNSVKGKLLKNLILKMTQHLPSDRTSLSDTLLSLKEIHDLKVFLEPPNKEDDNKTIGLPRKRPIGALEMTTLFSTTQPHVKNQAYSLIMRKYEAVLEEMAKCAQSVLLSNKRLILRSNITNLIYSVNKLTYQQDLLNWPLSQLNTLSYHLEEIIRNETQHNVDRLPLPLCVGNGHPTSRSIINQVKCAIKNLESQGYAAILERELNDVESVIIRPTHEPMTPEKTSSQDEELTAQFLAESNNSMNHNAKGPDEDHFLDPVFPKS